MVRLWSEEVGDARSVIEPVVQRVSSDVQVHVNGGEGFSKETVEVILTKGQRRARCIVTFEACQNARHDPEEMKAAFREIINDIESTTRLPAYLLTSRGLSREPTTKKPEVLRSMAGSREADLLAEAFFGRRPTV